MTPKGVKPGTRCKVKKGHMMKTILVSGTFTATDESTTFSSDEYGQYGTDWIFYDGKVVKL